MSVNNLSFDDFIKTLQKTNANLEYFTDFTKCDENLKKVSIDLHALNYLLGKEKLKEAIVELYLHNPKCFETLNLLIAVRDNKINLLDKNGNLVEMRNYFNDADKIYDFFVETKLAEIFIGKKITNLHDYVFGVEVGLDTNARKNRTGKAMESLVANNFLANNIKYKEQVNISEIFNLDLGDDIKKFDFTIKTASKHYLIEVNFYNTGGSKLNEVARSYIEISNKISYLNDYKFIWITDGSGWLDAKNKLSEAYKSVEIYNISNIANFIEKIKND
ncbi:type II restriction endonuclease [Campylobacter mucosalis]|uniref:type II restriction endonuclease n=1 Tax=Campylobacter mucosalis TaxID=202 RepID=UPI0014707975|nr:type II restriction endonuclease [Campylobacter mucosalis]